MDELAAKVRCKGAEVFWRRHFRVVILSTFILPGTMPLNGFSAGLADSNAVLVLEKCLPGGGGERVDLELEFPVRNGELLERGWGYAVLFGRGHHVPRIVRNARDGESRKLTVEVFVEPDNWVPGGEALLEIEVRQVPGGFEGTFAGSFRRGTRKIGGPDKAVPLCLVPEAKTSVRSEEDILGPLGDPIATQGKVTGRMAEAWPGVVLDYVPPEPGEHPRLAFRKKDVPLLRKRARETPEGIAILERAKAVVDAGPVQGDKFTTWPAVGHGYLYVITGDAKHAERARDIVRKTIFGNVNGRRGDAVVQDIHYGPRLHAMALALDLCYDAWDESFRVKCVDEIQRRTWELRLGEFEGVCMDGYNPNPWSNHNGIRTSCAGLGALVVMGETNSLGRVMEDAGNIADLMAWEARQYFLTGLGGGAYGMEGEHYKEMTQARGFAYFPPAYANARGMVVDAGTIGDFDMAGYILEADPAAASPAVPAVAWSVDIATVPRDMMPGVKWLFDRTVGLQGSRTFGIEYGMMAPFITALYPYDVEARNPVESLRWMSPDPRKGHWVFRPAFKDKDDILLSLNMKSETLFGSWAPSRAGTQCNMLLKGFGKLWIDGTFLVRLHSLDAFNIHHGGVLTSWMEGQDRTAVMNWNMDLAYLLEIPDGKRGAVSPEEFVKRRGGVAVRQVPNGILGVDFGIRATRSMAVDCSGVSGSPLLVAVVEQVSVPTNLTTVGPSGKAVAGRDLAEVDQQQALRALLKQAGVAVAGKNTTSAEPPRDAYTRWALPTRGVTNMRENMFVIGSESGPTLSGVMVGPARFASDAVVSDAKGTYFAVFTLQPGPAAQFAVEGEGLGAVVKVGKKTVRFDGGTLVLGEL